MKYRYNYEPPKDLEERVRNLITKELTNELDKEEDVMKVDLTRSTQLKFKVAYFFVYALFQDTSSAWNIYAVGKYRNISH